MSILPVMFAMAFDTSIFGGVDVCSANITRGSIVNPEPIQCFTGGIEGRLGETGDLLGINTVGVRVWTCNHLTSSRDNLMKRCFNETDPSLYFRNAYELAPSWRLVCETGPTWVLYRSFRNVPTSHETEWRVRIELDAPYATPYVFLRQTFIPYSLTYWRTGLKRVFALGEDVSVMPYSYLDWGDGNLFDFKYGQSQGHIRGGVSAMDAGIRMNCRLVECVSLWMQLDGYTIVNQRARRANDTRGSVTSRNGIVVFSTGLEVRF